MVTSSYLEPKEPEFSNTFRQTPAPGGVVVWLDVGNGHDTGCDPGSCMEQDVGRQRANPIRSKRLYANFF